MAQLLSQVAVGNIVKLNENRSPVNYIVVHQGLPSDLYDSSCNGTWLLRQDIIQNGTWNTSNANILPNSAIMHAMASMLPLYDQPIRDAIQTVKIPYCVGNGSSTVNSGANGLQCQIFPLSGYEVGWTASVSSYFPIDGAKLSYFVAGEDSAANQKRVANLNGSATYWWLRSPYTDSTSSVWYVDSVGGYYYWNANDSYGVRPALVLSSTLYVEDDGTISVAPPAPDSITVPPSATAGQSIAVSWAGVSGATQYKLERQVDSGSWDTVYTGSGTSYTDTAQAGWQSVVYRVSAGVSDVFGETKSSSAVSVLVATPTGLTVPSALMVSQTATISWDAVTGADGYKLERQVDSAGEWSTLYTGADLSYQDTAPSAAGTVTYRVSAGASGVYGAAATSAPVTVLAASALVISGTDGDLGTITAPVTYNVLTDTGNSVTVVENVDGTERTLTLTSGQEVSIPVARLTPGTGGITIKATVQSSSSPVSVTRTWTYSKTPASAPGGPYKVDQLQDQSGNMIAPQTLAEAVFLPSGESVAGRALSRNVVRTLPIAPGYSVSAGDVVDVSGGQIVKTMTGQANVENVIKTTAITDTAVCYLNSAYSVMVYTISNAVYARLIDNSTGAAVGSEVSVYSGTATNLSLARLSDTQFVAGYRYNSSYELKTGTVSGTNISFASKGATACNGEGLVVPMDEEHVVRIHVNEQLRAEVIKAIGTNETYPESISTIASAANLSAALLPDDSSGNHRVCVCFSDSGDGNKGKAVIATIDSANQVTWGDVVTFSEKSLGLGTTSCCTEENGNVYVSYTTSEHKVYVNKLNISEYTITPGNELQDPPLNSAYSNIISVGGTIVLSAQMETYGQSCVINDTNGELSYGSLFLFNQSNTDYVSAAPVSPSKFIVAYADRGNSSYGTTTILEVMGNQIAGSFTDESSTAIALQSGTAGQSIECIFSGTTNAAWATEGQIIDSPGVYGVGIMDGILQVWSKERPGQVVTGSYVGTGGHGLNNPNTLSFEKPPKQLLILRQAGSGPTLQGFMLWIFGSPKALNGSQYANYVSVTGNTISWYNQGNGSEEVYQCNMSGVTYYYIAIL